MSCPAGVKTLAFPIMMKRKPSLLVGAAFAGVTLALSHVPALRAQAVVASPAAVAPETFDYDLGTRDVNGATYTVKATQPVDSKLKSQRVRFFSKTSTAEGSTTKYFTVNTGKFKTVAQLNLYLHDAFAKFLAGAPANTEVGKVGDIKYGGEIRFVVQSPDVLLYNTMTVGEPNASMTLPRAEVLAYASILAGEPAAKQ